MSDRNLYKLLVIFVVGIFCYVFWQYISERFFNVEYPPEVSYEKIEIIYSPKEIKEIFNNE